MKSASCPFFLVLILILILALWPRRILSHGGHNKNPHLDMVTEACATTQYKDLCTSTIKECGSTGHDLHSAAKIAVKVAWTVTSEAQVTMKKMLNNTTSVTSVPFIQQCLIDCDATYDDAVANLKEAFEAFDVKAYGDIVTWVAAAMGDPHTCEGFFKKSAGYTCPVTGMNNAVVKLCSTALTLTKQCAEGKN